MRAIVSMACAVVLIGSASGAAAQGKGAPKVATAPAAGAATHGKSTTYKPAAAPKATGSTKTTTTAHGGTHSRTTETKATGSTKTTTTTPTTTTTTTPTGTAIPLTPVQQKLQKNTNLAGKLQSRLPAGTDLNTAAAGFRNLGQFVAAGTCAGPALEPAEEILHPVADAIVPLRVAHLLLAVRLPRNAVTVAEGLQCGPQLVTVESLVSDEQHRRVLVLEQFDHMGAFIGLSGNQFHAQRPAFKIGDHH